MKIKEISVCYCLMTDINDHQSTDTQATITATIEECESVNSCFQTLWGLVRDQVLAQPNKQMS